MPSREIASVREAPVADWVTIEALRKDPYPHYRRMREQSPVWFIPEAGAYCIVDYAACASARVADDAFSSDGGAENSPTTRVMGHSMISKDGEAHDRERRAYGGTLKPRAVGEVWEEIFRSTATQLLDELLERGTVADLVADFAAPYAAENLRRVLGFRDSSWQDIQRWSVTMFEAIMQVGVDDAQIWERSNTSSQEIDDAIEALIPSLRAQPDRTLLSSLVNSEEGLDVGSIAANMKMTIGGGFNEPQHALGTAVWALLAHPDQLAASMSTANFAAVFDETVRWIAPIQNSGRYTTRDVVLGGVRIPEHRRVLIGWGAANRDPRVFDAPDTFDISRERKPHFAFGGVRHFCAGSWLAKAQVAKVALPMIFAGLPGLRMVGEVVPFGWEFRGMPSLPVAWDR